ncbi:MAG: MBL fold metallo-hydrolase, partial [Alphaproteobacteria bacterium]|nr:MBL fold metallo-hydrolase [Alphaproteobacteria bacterium]
FNEAYAIDDSYRVKHHGAAMLPPAAAPLEAVVVAMPNGKNAPVFNVNGLKVTAVRVTHHPADPAYGYRFDYVGRSVTVSGDTAYDENLARAATNTDVLVHEGLQPEMVGIMEQAMLNAGRPRPAKIMHDIPAYHTAPVDAAKIANLAHARLLLFTHILPIVPDNAVFIRVFLKGVEDVRPDGVKVGHDGTIVRLKKGDTEVQVSDL